jgi:hypothetical protein
MGMREEFERTNGRDHRRQPPKGNNYIDPMAQMDWESFQKGWNQSRAALVIELKRYDQSYGCDEWYQSDDGSMMDSDEVITALTDAGVSYK